MRPPPIWVVQAIARYVVARFDDGQETLPEIKGLFERYAGWSC